MSREYAPGASSATFAAFAPPSPVALAPAIFPGDAGLEERVIRRELAVLAEVERRQTAYAASVREYVRARVYRIRHQQRTQRRRTHSLRAVVARAEGSSPPAAVAGGSESSEPDGGSDADDGDSPNGVSGARFATHATSAAVLR